MSRPLASCKTPIPIVKPLAQTLLEGRLGQADNFLYRLALHHVGDVAFASPPLLHRLLATLPPHTSLDLCCCADLGAPPTLPSRSGALVEVAAARLPAVREAAEHTVLAKLAPALVAALGLGAVV